MSIILLQSMKAVSHDLIPFSTRMIERTSACGVQWPAVPLSAGVHLQPHQLLPLPCWKILRSTTVDPSLHATSSISFAKRRTTAFQAWIARLHERSSRRLLPMVSNLSPPTSGCKLRQVFSSGRS